MARIRVKLRRRTRLIGFARGKYVFSVIDLEFQYVLKYAAKKEKNVFEACISNFVQKVGFTRWKQ